MFRGFYIVAIFVHALVCVGKFHFLCNMHSMFLFCNSCFSIVPLIFSVVYLLLVVVTSASTVSNFLCWVFVVLYLLILSQIPSCQCCYLFIIPSARIVPHIVLISLIYVTPRYICTQLICFIWTRVRSKSFACSVIAMSFTLRLCCT